MNLNFIGAQAQPELALKILKWKRLIDLRKLTSKEIRQEITQLDPICIFKLGAINTPSVSLNWGYALSKVTSVRHKSCLLRVAHGEVYTKEKLHKYNLILKQVLTEITFFPKNAFEAKAILKDNTFFKTRISTILNLMIKYSF